jgi:predicted nucleic acid-binding protein
MIIDSTFLNDLVRRDDSAVAELDKLIETDTPVALSTLTVYEVGVGLRGDAAQFRDRYDGILEKMDGAPVTQAAASRAVGVQQKLMDQGDRIGAVDALIAATALTVDDGRVLTRNVDEFERVDDLVVCSY